MQIHTQGLTHRFGARTLFQGLELRIDSGITVITGPNGSGKSTLLQILCGLLTPTAGQVHWQLGDQQLDRDALRARLGYCAPAMSLYDELSTAENLAFLDDLRTCPPREDRADLFDLTALLPLPFRKLSSGQQQRVKLAQAFHPATSVLALDEPTTNLDDANVQRIHRLIREAADSQLVLLASNDERDLALAGTTIRL